MASRKPKDLDTRSASALDLSVVKDGNGNTSSNQNFIASDTDADDLDIVGHPVIVGSVICAICVQGKAVIRINFETYTLSPGGFIILAPGSMFLCEEGDHSDDFVAKYISFSPSYIKGISFGHIMYDIKNIPYIQMNEEEYATIIDIYNQLRARYLNFDHPYRQEVIQHSLLTALYDFSVIYDKYTLVINETEQDSYLTRFIDLLFKHYRQHRQTGFYAGKLNITPKYLSKIIKEETGSSVQDWIFQLILFETKSLLRSTNMHVAEIADHFDFPDSSSFGKFFRKYEKMTPLEYRNRKG